MKKCRNVFPLIFLAVILLFPAICKADATASAVWGVGVQLGYTELGANQGVSPNTLALSLSYARDLARQSGCISPDEIERLRLAMSQTTDSRTLYQRITAYRQRLPASIQRNCQCAGGGKAALALWGLGVQIGYAELASYLGIPVGTLVQSLTLARNQASLTNCIDTKMLDRLIAAMRRTNDSRTLYQSITTYRQGQLLSEVQRDCSCSSTFQITSVTLPPRVKLNGAKGDLRIWWTGKPVYPVQVVYAPDSCPPGHNCSTVRMTINAPTNPIIFKGSVWCFGRISSSVLFDYSVYLQDARGARTNLRNADFTCVL